MTAPDPSSGGLTEAEREELDRIIRWHVGADRQQPNGGYTTAGVMNVCAAVERILAARLADARREALLGAADRMPAFHDRDAAEWAITSACKWLRDRANQDTP